MQDRSWWGIAALSGALVVMAGAFGAHALEGQLAPRLAAAFETGCAIRPGTPWRC